MNYLETIGTAVGLAYLWLEYRASIWLWLAGIVMPAIYIFVYYSSGFYADMAVNVYYLGAGIYGWFMWRKRGGFCWGVENGQILHIRPHTVHI